MTTPETATRVCGLVPTLDNPETIRAVALALRQHLDLVIVVDDGSGRAGRDACQALADDGTARVIRHDRNGGKGAAVKTGLAAAHEAGFTHALQVDADGQHDLRDVPQFLAACRERPEALVLGSPRYDGTAPRGRRIGRRVTNFWVRVEAGSAIDDAMCGFRVYPVTAALRARARGDAMDFDPEIAVRLVWAGLPVINVPTHVRYLDQDEGGVSHFRVFWDNVLISWLHCRLATRRVVGSFFGALGRWLTRAPVLPRGNG